MSTVCPGRDAETLVHVTEYLKAVGMFRDYTDARQDPDFTQVWAPTRRDRRRHGLENSVPSPAGGGAGPRRRGALLQRTQAPPGPHPRVGHEEGL